MTVLGKQRLFKAAESGVEGQSMGDETKIYRKH